MNFNYCQFTMARNTHIGISLIFLCIVLMILVINVYKETLWIDMRSERLAKNIAQYESMRRELLVHERFTYLGGHVDLNMLELQLNRRLMSEKYDEYDRSVETPCDFKPAQHFFHVFENMSGTALFDLIRSMPKGGMLYAHDMALCSTNFLIELSYRDNLWICLRDNVMENRCLSRFEKLLFSLDKPFEERSCKWQLLRELRELEGKAQVDQELKASLTLYPLEKFLSTNEVWQSLEQLISFVYGLLTYAPIWSDYFHRALQEFYEDGVQYLELRTSLPILYDLNHRNYTQLDTARILKEVNQKFMCSHPDYIGSKMIYAPSRNATDEEFDNYLATAKSIKEMYPEFFAGFDLTRSQSGYERSLQDFSHKLIMHDNIDLYFHLGDSNLFMTPTDEDLIDAVLLGTKRIGNTLGLLRHPDVLRYVALNDIGIEVNPMSNQAVQLASDYNNHPSAHFLASNYPVVIASDFPSYWKSTPLSHDFYITFLGIASRPADLGLLKKLAWNSLKYSAISCDKKEQAFTKFMQNWSNWVNQKISAGL